MTFTRTIVLGFLAGATVGLGLLIGRIRHAIPRVRAILNALAIGILIFLIVDVLRHALEPLSNAVATHHLGLVVLRTSYLIGGIGIGLFSLVGYDVFSKRRRGRADNTHNTRHNAGHDAIALSTLIAIGMGLHNFGEGLAIGASARSGLLGLSTVLVVGFALHNATEGFGIVGPLIGSERQPGWGTLLLLGLIGGGPTTLGTLVGWYWSNPSVTIIFFALAAGSIVYVISQLFVVAQRQKAGTLLYVGMMLGLSLGFVTDVIVSWSGA